MSETSLVGSDGHVRGPALNPEKLDGNYRDLVHDAIAALNPCEWISGQTVIRVRP